MKTFEKEEKYLVKLNGEKELWDKEYIIYQWYLTASYEENTKIKVIFDFQTLKSRLVKVRKMRVKDNIFEKDIKCLDKDEIDFSELIGCPFVAKRRSIRKNIFLDRFIKSNGLCEYLLEIEDASEENENNNLLNNIILLKNVKNDPRYYNQNLCILFDDLEYKIFLTLIDWFEF